MLTPLLPLPLAVGLMDRWGGHGSMKLEMHLHLNSELASNEFLTEFALNFICMI